MAEKQGAGSGGTDASSALNTAIAEARAFNTSVAQAIADIGAAITEANAVKSQLVAEKNSALSSISTTVAQVLANIQLPIPDSGMAPSVRHRPPDWEPGDPETSGPK